MDRDFEGKTVIVTGAGSGIGAAICRELGARGANVLAADLDDEAAAGVAREIGEAGGAARHKAVDVAQPDQVEAMVAAALEMGGGLHGLVNNAGIGGPLVPLGEYTLEDWHRVIDINLHGVFYGMRFAIPEMEKAGGGSIVNMGSILSSVGFGNASAYVAAKHALMGMTKTAAIEYAEKKIRINGVGPGFIRTPLLDALGEEALGQIAQMHPVKRLGTPEEVSALTCFLLSDRAGFITGSYHLVDGGYTAQ